MNAKVKINSVVNNIQFIIFIITGFINAPVIISKLGAEDYGIWIFIMSLVSYSSVLYLGFGQSIIKYTSEYTTKKDYASANSVLGTVFTFYTIIGAVAFLIALILAWQLPNMIAMPSGRVSEYRLAMIVVSFQIAFMFPSSAFGGVLMGLQKYVYTSASRTIACLVNFAIILLTPKEHFSILLVAFVFMITTTISHSIDILVVSVTEKNLKVSFKNFSKERFKNLFSFSVHSFVIVISDKLIELTDTIIIGIYLSPVAVALYSVPQRLVQYLRMLLLKTSEVLFPHFSSLLAQNKHDDIKETWINGYRASLAIASCITVVYFTFGDVFQVLWMGKEFGSMYKILVILSLGFILNQPITNSFLIAVEKHKITSKLSLLQALLNILLSLIFVRHWGMVGVAVASCIPSFVISSLILPFMANRLIGISAGSFFVKSLLPSLACSVVPTAVLFWIKSMGFGKNYFEFGSICAICVVLFAIPYLLFFDRNLIRFKK